MRLPFKEPKTQQPQIIPKSNVKAVYSWMDEGNGGKM